MKTLKKAQTAYYVSLCMLTMAKTLPHAILTILLYAKGLNLSEILFIQAIFNGIVLASEFPSGIVSDLYGRKRIFLCANIAMMIMCILVLCTNGFLPMAVAWGMYGFSEALNSGTIDASLINIYKKKSSNPTLDITRFKKVSNQLQLIAMIIGAATGSYLYLRIGVNMYILSLVLVCMSTAIITLRFPQDSYAESKNASAISQIRGGLKEIVGDRRLKYLILLTAVSQIFFTIHYNLWQAYVLDIGFSNNSLIWFYLVFQIIGIISFQIPIKQIRKIIIITGGAVTIIAPLFIFSDSLWCSVISYCTSIFCFSFLQYLYDVLFSLYISEQRISTMITFNSTISRIAGFLTLGMSGFVIPLINIKYVIVFSFEIAVFGSLILIGVFVYRNKRQNHPLSSDR